MSEKILLITTDQVITFNKEIVLKEKQIHQCLDRGKVESATHSAFYPGDYPFQYGDIAQIAGALCFFIAKAHGFFDGNKRTAAISAVTFMNLNGYDLFYDIDQKNNMNEFVLMIEQMVKNEITKEDILIWFNSNKKII